MSIKQFNDYIEVFLDNREFFRKNAEDDVTDKLNLSTLALVSTAYLKRNDKVRDVVHDAVRTSPQYLLYAFDIEERETWNSLSFSEKMGIKMISTYRKVKSWTKFTYLSLKWKVERTWKKYFPPKPVPQTVEEEKPAPTEENLAQLQKMFKHLEGVSAVEYIKHPLEPTVIVEANIEKHAPGNVVAALWHEEPEGVMDSVKIKSYNVVPGKNPYTDEYESGYSPLNSQANFTEMGNLPAYIAPNHPEFSARTK